MDELESAILNEISELDINSVLDNQTKDQSLKVLKQNIESLNIQLITIQDQRTRLIDALANGDKGLGAITDRVRSLTNQEQDLKDTILVLNEEYDIEFHRLGAVKQSVEEIKRLNSQLNDNDIRIKLQTEVRRLVDKIVLHFRIKKFVIYYHKPKMVVRFQNGKSISFVESEADYVDESIQIG